jgi:hypothetical protein
MNATLYTGDGTTSKTIANGVAGQSFQPDFVWIKCRSQGYRHSVFDVVRGFGQHLQPSFTDPENTVGTTAGTSFFLGATSTGFTVGVPTSGTYSGNLGTNDSGATFVGWNWKAGGTAVSNTSGSITSQVSANTTSGFSVVTYTSTTGTVGHGLGVAPAMIIMKGRNVNDQWTVGHKDLNGGSSPWNYGIPLNTTASTQTNSGFWNNTAPTSTVFSQGSWDGGYTKVAYCWAPIAGYSAFGSYTGNGSADGTFVYTGFRPRFLMIKRTDTTSNWFILDTSRDTYNVSTDLLFPNLSDAEDASSPRMDILSNGFKNRQAAVMNASGGTFIYAAFAENPFKYANAR